MNPTRTPGIEFHMSRETTDGRHGPQARCAPAVVHRIDVSVLVPVRDGACWLPTTLRSLRRLRGAGIEIVFVDDGSVDETPALLRAAAQLDRRVRVETRPRCGLVAALEYGISVASGRFIARLDADDVTHPDRMTLQRDAARRHGWAVVGRIDF